MSQFSGNFPDARTDGRKGVNLQDLTSKGGGSKNQTYQQVVLNINNQIQLKYKKNHRSSIEKKTIKTCISICKCTCGFLEFTRKYLSSGGQIVRCNKNMHSVCLWNDFNTMESDKYEDYTNYLHFEKTYGNNINQFLARLGGWKGFFII